MNHTIRNVFLLMANVLSHALWGTTAWADSLSINVIDEQGQPIANAVVLVDSDADVTIGQTKSSPATAKIMDQVNVQFSPRLLLVNHGDYVNFPNSDNVRHHVYSFSEAQPFELRLYAGKPENPIQFTNSGLVVLGCNIHDQMQGYIYVSSTPFSAISDENGQVSIDYSGKIQQVRLWHEKYNIDERLHLILSANEFEQSKNTDGSYTLTLKLERKLSSPSSNQETSNTFSNSFRRGLD